MGRIRHLAGVGLFGLVAATAAAQFSAPPNFTVPTNGGATPVFVIARDFDNDGVVEIVVATDSPSIQYFENNGAGIFTFTDEEAGVGGPGATDGMLEVADVDRDGDLDVYYSYMGAGGAGGDGFEIFLNDGSGGFTADGVFYPITTATIDVIRFRVADVNADGFPDVVMASIASAAPFEDRATVTLHSGGAAGAFYANALPATTIYGVPAPDAFPDSVTAMGVEVSDLDGDGDMDIALGAFDASGVEDGLVVHENNGAGVFTMLAGSPFPMASVGPSLIELLAADFDGDGDEDLACLTLPGGLINLEFFTNAGGLAFAAGPDPAGDTNAGADLRTTLSALDFNVDGIIDLVRGDLDGETINIYSDPFAGLIETIVASPDPGNSDLRSVTVGDVDGDRIPDLIVADAHATTPQFAVYINTAAGPVTALAITTGCPLAAGITGFAYTNQVTASGGTTPQRFLILGGALPTGLTLNPITGAIAGFPTTQGTFTFTLAVIDPSGHVGTSACSMTVIRAAAESGSECVDGVDNDSDTLIDRADPDCGGVPTGETSCTDGIDNDFDTQIDCSDSDCGASPACSTQRETTRGSNGGASGWLPCSAVPAFGGLEGTGLWVLAVAVMAVGALRRRA